MKRIVIYNPHNELWFGITLKFWLYRRPWVPKYAYVVRQILKKKGVFYALASTSCMENGLLQRFAEFLKFKIWAMINGYNPFMCTLLFDSGLVEKNDFLVVIYIGNFSSFSGEVSSNSLVSYLNKAKGKIILNVNHYPYHPSSGSEAIMSLRFHYFWAENNLEINSGYFKTYFGKFKKPFIVTPFAVRSKFKYRTSLNLRMPKAVAVGSVSLKMTQDKDFVEYFGHDNLQPIRNELYGGIPNEFNTIIESHVSHINEGGAARPVRNASSLMEAISNLKHNIFNYGQHKYHALDMCDIFNKYSIHIVGEEVVGIPGIGFAEGMMCGSVFIGLDDPMYTDLGMVPGMHYLTYDGTYLSLLDTIREFLKKPETLLKISMAGYAFACKNFTESSVFESLENQIL